MTADEMRAMANGLMPILVRAVADARAKDAATIKALEERILELETKPTAPLIPSPAISDLGIQITELIAAIEAEARKQL